MTAPACLPTSATVTLSVMAGLVPAIHAFPQRVDPRDKPGDDGSCPRADERNRHPLRHGRARPGHPRLSPVRGSPGQARG
ncbi:hypothetical protein SLNSH_24150 [Alsobacter soli]|uniref:Uncharacterized protein n=1 Tax=Alsobacter soli TaxID=2109933 RepID=A0A2T1HLA3_9HYPH|nr:hypothetical protein SLNSH_24150 [Alsobacter soli]